MTGLVEKHLAEVLGAAAWRRAPLPAPGRAAAAAAS